MKISLDIVLKDVPGQLVKALEPISRLGGNIISIVHLRETIKGGRLPVHVTFEVESSDRLDKILNELERGDIWISQLDEVKKKEKITVVLIGHIVDTNMRDTIDKVNAIDGVMVADVSLAMPHPDKESSARIDIEVSDSKKAKIAMKRLEKIAEEKKLFVIKSLGVRA